MHLLSSLGLKRRKYSTSTPALPIGNSNAASSGMPLPTATPPPAPHHQPTTMVAEEGGAMVMDGVRGVASAPATPAFYHPHLKRSSCMVTSPSLADMEEADEEVGEDERCTTTTTTTSTSNAREWLQEQEDEDREDTDPLQKQEEEDEEGSDDGSQPTTSRREAHDDGEATKDRGKRVEQRKQERRDKRERKREEKKEKKEEKKKAANNRGRWGWVREEHQSRDADEEARREAEAAEEEEEDMRVLLAASHLQGETRNQTPFACSGRAKDLPKKDNKTKKKTTTTKEKEKKKKKKEKTTGGGGGGAVEVKKTRRERKLEKRENKKDKKQRKIDKELQRQREKEEKRLSSRSSRNRGHARSSSDGVRLMPRGGGSAGGSPPAADADAALSSSASMSLITAPTSRDVAPGGKQQHKKGWRLTWRMSSIACLGRTPSMDEVDERSTTSSTTSDSHARDGPKGGGEKRKSTKIDSKGKDKVDQHHEEDDDPDKKSGPGKVLEEGTVEPCGEDGEEEGWSEESVEWCGVTYAKNHLPPFDTCGLRAKTAYNPNHALWLATAAALAYRSPAQIRHVVTRIWEWEDMEFFHNAETDTQGFGMYGKDCIVICFRGTESSRDWSTNIKISETEPFPDMPAVKVHNGFNRALTSVLEQVVDFIHKGLSFDPCLPLYITGHSLGGALANLCLAYFTFPSSPFLLKSVSDCAHTDRSSSNSSSSSSSSSSSCGPDEWQIAKPRKLIKGVYTFGQPKVGNDQFAYELRLHSAGTVFFRLTNNNDLVPFVPRRLYVHCGTRIFFSEAGHIVQGDEAARPAREFWRENNHGRMFKRKRQGFRDHLVKSYVAFLREHYRINEAILMSPLRKDMSLLRFHDMERAKLSCEEMRKLVSYDSVIEGLKHMTVSDLMDTKSLTMTAKQRKKEAQTLGRKWLREQLWEKLKDNEDQQICKMYKLLKGEVEKKKAKFRGDSMKFHTTADGTGDPAPDSKEKQKDGPMGAIFASFASFKDAFRPNTT